MRSKEQIKLRYFISTFFKEIGLKVNWRSENRTFVQISNGFWQNGSHVSRFQMVGFLYFRSHLKSGPLTTQTLFDHSKSRPVQISDPTILKNYEDFEIKLNFLNLPETNRWYIPKWDLLETKKQKLLLMKLSTLYNILWR